MALNTGLLGKEINSGQFGEFSDLGSSQLSAGIYDIGGNRYNVSDTGHGTRIVNKVGSLGEIQAQDALKQQNALTQQAISTLQAQQPKIGEIYQGKQSYLQSQIDPTKARYDALIADIKGQQQTSEEEQTKVTNAEMARRGISNQSGYSQQELQNVLNPIRRNYAGLEQQTGLAQEADIKAINDAIKLLAGEQTGQEMNLAQLISNAQLGGASNYGSQAQLLLNQALAQAQQETSATEAANLNNYRNQQLALEQQLQPGQITAQNLANQAAQLALDRARISGNVTPESLVTATTAGTASGKPFDWLSFGLQMPSNYAGNNAYNFSRQGF